MSLARLSKNGTAPEASVPGYTLAGNFSFQRQGTGAGAVTVIAATGITATATGASESIRWSGSETGCSRPSRLPSSRTWATSCSSNGRPKSTS